MNQRLQINEKLLFFYTTPKRFKVAYGGRNGGKSHDIALALLVLGSEKTCLILCVREFRRNLQDSVHRLLSKKIRQDPMLRDFYTIQKELIRGKNGTQILFEGIKNPENLKSFEDADYAWVEEAAPLSADGLITLIPTIRKPGSEIWFSFNPKYANDPIYQFGVVSPRPPEDMISVKINYMENPNCPPDMLKEARWCKQHDPDLYNHAWLGEPLTHSEAAIYAKRFESKDFTVDWINGLPYFNNQRINFKYGLDFGFNNPLALIQSFVQDGYLYIYREIYACEVDTDDIGVRIEDTFPELIKFKSLIYADGQQPGTISQLRKARRHRDGTLLPGLNVVAAIKGANSKKEGITYIKNFNKIYVHTTCKNTLFEFENYKYKVAKDGTITDEIIDKNNHALDAMRYSYNEEIQGKKRTIAIGSHVVDALKHVLGQGL